MFITRRKSAAALFFAVACMLLFNSWLQLHHGHAPTDGLFPGRHTHSHAVLSGDYCEYSPGGSPGVSYHDYELVTHGYCLICALFNLNGPPRSSVSFSTATGLSSAVCANSRFNFHNSGKLTNHLRAPPLSA